MRLLDDGTKSQTQVTDGDGRGLVVSVSGPPVGIEEREGVGT